MASTSNRFKNIAEEVREETNKTLSREIAALVPLSQQDIERLVPTKADKENLARLMSIVSERSKENEKVAKVVGNIDSFGTVIVRLLRKVMV